MSESNEKTKSKATTEPSNVKKPSDTVSPGAGGCTPSFLNREKDEIDKTCGAIPPNPKEEYVQKDEEKEAGGEA